MNINIVVLIAFLGSLAWHFFQMGSIEKDKTLKDDQRLEKESEEWSNLSILFALILGICVIFAPTSLDDGRVLLGFVLAIVSCFLAKWFIKRQRKMLKLK